MTSVRLVDVASAFQAASERLHVRFLQMRSDDECAKCPSAAFGEAILTARIQVAWAEFTRKLVVWSALGAQRRGGSWIQPLVGVTTEADAERAVRRATKEVVRHRGFASPIWHAPWFALLVGERLVLDNLNALETTLGSTLAPGQITIVRNVLVHPETKAQKKYEDLQAKLGMLGVEPELLPRQLISPSVAVFTSWIRELQSVADDSTQ